MPRQNAWLWRLASVGMVLAVLGGVALGITLWRLAATLPDPSGLTRYHPPVKSVILSADGQVLASLYVENREWAALGEIPPSLQQATLAIEDHRFYRHHGVDVIGIARALAANLRAGRVTQGGSTLTQQLARNLYLKPERTMERKLRGLILAWRIEKKLSKARILELYLNQVYYGSGAYGVKAAAKVYFGKPMDQLTLAEAALLAGLPARPAALSPFRNRAAALQRRNTVLARMADLKMVTRAQANAAMREEMKLAPEAWARRLRRAPYFVDWIERQLVARFGKEALYGDGLVIYTTINLEMQLAAEEAVRAGLARGQSRGRVEQAALVALDPRTGQIRAMVGGKEYARSQFNRAANARGRQPGSAFKPIVYAAALEHGYTPETILDDSPLELMDNGKPWRPGNYDDEFRGPVTLHQALIQSINVPAIRVGLALGPKRVAHYARTFGLRGPIHPVPSIAIGTSEVTPLEIAAVYAIFANGGKRVKPQGILRVESRDGKVLWAPAGESQQVLPRDTATTMAMLLRDVVLHGTGRAAAGVPNAAGKTGTTQDDRDAWFVGFTPQLVAAVWAGNDDRSPMGGQIFGGTVPAPIWAQFMRRAAPLAAANTGTTTAVIPSYRARHAEQQAAEEEAPTDEDEDAVRPPRLDPWAPPGLLGALRSIGIPVPVPHPPISGPAS